MKYTISEIESLICNLNEENIKYSNHAKQRLVDRNIDLNDVNKSILSCILFSITYQEENRYKLILKFDEFYDLYLIVSIINSKALKTITVYINFIDKRVRY